MWDFTIQSLCPILLDKFAILQWHLRNMLADMVVRTTKVNQKHLALFSSQNTLINQASLNVTTEMKEAEDYT